MKKRNLRTQGTRMAGIAGCLIGISLGIGVIPVRAADFVLKATENQLFEEQVVFPEAYPELCDLKVVSAPAWLTAVDLGHGSLGINGTPSSDERGANYLMVQCTAAGQTHTHQVKIVVGTAFDTWLSANVTETASQLPEGDPDEDKVSNFWEYIHGSNPQGVETEPLVRLYQDDSDDQVRFRFVKRKVLEDVVLTPEWSPDLGSGSWSADGLQVTDISDDVNKEWISYRLDDSNNALPQAFFRLNAVLQNQAGENTGLPATFNVDASRSEAVTMDIPIPGEDRQGWQFLIISGPTIGQVTGFDPAAGSFTYQSGAAGTAFDDHIYYKATSPLEETIDGEIVLTLSQEVTVTIPVVLTGVPDGTKATVIISAPGYLFSQSTVGSGTVSFENIRVRPGNYTLKVVSQGYQFGQTRLFEVTTGGAVTTPSESNKAFQPSASATADLSLEAQPVSGHTFRFHWEEDVSVSGSEYMAYINTPPEVTFLDEDIEEVDLAAAEQLQTIFNIILDNGESPWSQEHASRLMKTLDNIPQPIVRNFYAGQHLTPSIWQLSTGHLTNDIEIDDSGDVLKVRISAHAFVNAAPSLAEVDGRRGIWYSKRLHRALLRYVTDEGRSHSAVDHILRERFNVETAIPDYSLLTALTTGEQESNFQDFSPQELLTIIDIFEEMPSGFHRIPQLRYIVRRAGGHIHPLYPQAPAVAWPDAGYIEFMDTAFTAHIEHVHRLIIHEKAHFIWHHMLSSETRNYWTILGGWYQNGSDQWFSTRTTEFVSAYAHRNGPEEDFAESIAYFTLNPDKLSARSLPKYDFIRDRIMQGNIYLSQIRQDLTFEVFNLYPDYIYPGKVRRVDITVSGEPEEDKSVTIEMELASIDFVFDDAHSVFLRLFSEIGTYQDIHLYPAGTTENGFVFNNTVAISRFAKAGYWMPDQIRIRDLAGNHRFEDIKQFGWTLYIDNPLEDLIAPEFVPDSHQIEIAAANYDGHPVHQVTATWQFVDDSSMGGLAAVYGRILTPGSGQRIDEYGTFAFLETTEDGYSLYEASVTFLVTEYHPSGEYQFPFLFIRDAANNTTSLNFISGDPDRDLLTFSINTANPDVAAPELNLNDITINAFPVSPAFPDGETIVLLTYSVRDDLSGLGQVNFRLRDPQGTEHFYYHYHDNFYTDYFVGDPTVWKTYQATIILPKGSPPGTWGLSSLHLQDKGLNGISHSFLEVIHFDVWE